MGSAVFDSIEREIDAEVRARFPGAIEGFLLELIARLREIRMVELTFSKDPATSEKDGPGDRIMEFGQRLADLQAWERGETAHVPAHLGPAGLETVDTLILAGVADDRADAIRLVLPKFRGQPEYEQFRERVREIERLRAEV